MLSIFIFITFLVSLKLAFHAVASESISSPMTCPARTASSASPNGEITTEDPYYTNKPFIDGMKVFRNGEIIDWEGPGDIVSSPIIDRSTGKRIPLGQLPQMSSADSLKALDSAKLAWSNGQGTWPQMSSEDRIKAIENVVLSLKAKRDKIIQVLMWEICKTADDAAAEFDRTMIFVESVIKAFRGSDESWKTVSGIMAKVRRAAIGIMLCLGPFNYPFNETYATLIPALLAGNIVIMKIPSIGGLAHILTMEAYRDHLPPGTLNFISGSGRETMPPIMSTGDIDVLAFIGGSKAADALIKTHPRPHRLKVFLQLEGKNLGIVLPDADIETAVDQITIGSTTYNGQRCTAIKLIFVHESLKNQFIPKFVDKISSLHTGLPWEPNVSITPLPEPNKPSYLLSLIEDAKSNGAKVINEDCGGGQLSGALMVPAIVFPVTSSMRLWSEEQFGPVIPIATYSNIEEIYQYVSQTHYGQQASIFTSDSASSAPLLDVLSTAVGRVNINTQCGRSPDVFPFSGRRSSAMGTMSISETLRVFSTETLVAAKRNDGNEGILRGYESHSKFMAPLAQP